MARNITSCSSLTLDQFYTPGLPGLSTVSDKNEVECLRDLTERCLVNLSYQTIRLVHDQVFQTHLDNVLCSCNEVRNVCSVSLCL